MGAFSWVLYLVCIYHRATMSGKVRELPTDKEIQEMEDSSGAPAPKAKKASAATFKDDVPSGDAGDDVFADTKSKTIAEREDAYRAQRTKRALSPDRADPFAADTPAPE